jgi:CO/xanthine dehydrogenase FAD-binding subunit
MAFDAILELTHLGGSRKIPIKDFYLSYRKTALQPNEILTKIIIPKQRADERSAFYKVGTRKAQAISKVAFCARSLIVPPAHDRARVAGGANPPLEKGGTDRNSPLWKRGGGGDLRMQNGVIEDIAIALGSVAPTVIRAPKTEGYLKGKKLGLSIIEEARIMLSGEVVPIDDIRSTADYRRFVAGNLLARYLNDIYSASPLP